MTIQITKENFQSEVMESNVPVLVDFFATWCGPCKMLSPVLDQVAAENTDFKVCKVDVDAEPELAAQFKVMSVPTLVVIKDGQVVNQASGFRPKDQVVKLVK